MPTLNDILKKKDNQIALKNYETRGDFGLNASITLEEAEEDINIVVTTGTNAGKSPEEISRLVEEYKNWDDPSQPPSDLLSNITTRINESWVHPAIADQQNQEAEAIEKEENKIREFEIKNEIKKGKMYPNYLKMIKELEELGDWKEAPEGVTPFELQYYNYDQSQPYEAFQSTEDLQQNITEIERRLNDARFKQFKAEQFQRQHPVLSKVKEAAIDTGKDVVKGTKAAVDIVAPGGMPLISTGPQGFLAGMTVAEKAYNAIKEGLRKIIPEKVKYWENLSFADYTIEKLEPIPDQPGKYEPTGEPIHTGKLRYEPLVKVSLGILAGLAANYAVKSIADGVLYNNFMTAGMAENQAALNRAVKEVGKSGSKNLKTFIKNRGPIWKNYVSKTYKINPTPENKAVLKFVEDKVNDFDLQLFAKDIPGQRDLFAGLSPIGPTVPLEPPITVREPVIEGPPIAEPSKVDQILELAKGIKKPLKPPKKTIITAIKEYNYKKEATELFGKKKGEGVGETVKKIVKQIDRKWIDDTGVLYELSKRKWAKEMNPEIKTDPWVQYKGATDSARSLGIADSIRVLKPFRKRNRKDLFDIISYATAKTLLSRTLKDEGYEVVEGWTTKRLKQLIKTIEKKDNFNKVMIGYNDFRKNVIDEGILKPLVEEGLLEEEVRQKFMASESYFPTRKIMEVFKNDSLLSEDEITSDKIKYPLQRLRRGSKDLIQNPMETVSDMIQATRQAIESKRIKVAIIETGKAIAPEDIYRVYEGADKKVVSKLKKELLAQGNTAEEIQKILKKSFIGSDKRLQGMKNVVTADEIRNNPNKYMIYYEGNLKQIWKIPEALGGILNNISSFESGPLVSILRHSSALFRSGATLLSRKFALRNPFRDAQTATFLSEHPDTFNLPFYTPLKMFAKLGIESIKSPLRMENLAGEIGLKKLKNTELITGQTIGEFMEEWEKRAIQDSYMFAPDPEKGLKKVTRMPSPNEKREFYGAIAKDIVLKGLNPFTYIIGFSNFSEFFTRFSALDIAKKYIGKEGLDDTYGSYGSMQAKRISGDPKQKGDSVVAGIVIKLGRSFAQFRWNIFNNTWKNIQRGGSVTQIFGKIKFHKQAKAEGLKKNSKAYKERVNELYAEEFKKRKRNFRLKKGMVAAGLAIYNAGLFYLNHRNEDYRLAWNAVPRWKRETNDIYIQNPPWIEVNGEMTPNYVSIPKDDMAAALGNTTQGIIEFMYDKDPTILQRIPQYLFSALPLGLLKFGLRDIQRPFTEIKQNIDWKGDPIVHPSAQKFAPKYLWANRYTGEAERKIAIALFDKTGIQIAPAHMQHVIRGLTASLGGDALNLINRFFPIPEERRKTAKPFEIIPLKSVFKGGTSYTEYDRQIREAEKFVREFKKGFTSSIKYGAYTSDDRKRIGVFIDDQIKYWTKEVEKAKKGKNEIIKKQYKISKKWLIENRGWKDSDFEGRAKEVINSIRLRQQKRDK